MTSPAREPPIDWRLPFLAQTALGRGVTYDQLRSAAWVRVFTGVYVSAAIPLDARTRARAGLLLHPPKAHASHTTSALLLGVPVPADPDAHVTVDEQLDRRPQPGLRAHVREAGSDVVLVDGIRTSSPRQLFHELAGQLSLVQVVIAGDAMVRAGLCTLDELVTYCFALKGKNSRRAKRAVTYVRDGVDSPMETMVRMLLVLAGFPQPRVNVKKRDADGNVYAQFDLAYETQKVAVLFDGRHHIRREAAWRKDVLQREALEQEGWLVIVVVSDDIYAHPAQTLARVRKALRSRGLIVRRINPRWREHFPRR